MGREIRRVPPNWQHPRQSTLQLVPHQGYQYVEVNMPMYDQTFESAAAEWKTEYAKWECGEFPEYSTDEGRRDQEYWEYSGPPPERSRYRPWKDEEATWYQLWETVSEGTPISPPFATLDELATYLAAHGDEWDQKRGQGGWGMERAQAFCRIGWAPSGMIAN